eukprot:Gb_09211 [translate_table: standard]
MLSSIPQVFPFFKKGGPLIDNSSESSFCSTSKSENETSLPLLKVSTDREAYRPGDLINATVEIYNQKCSVDNSAETELEADVRDAIQIENLIVEVKGIEKLDTQWFVTQKPSPGSKQRRGLMQFSLSLIFFSPHFISQTISNMISFLLSNFAFTFQSEAA